MPNHILNPLNTNFYLLEKDIAIATFLILVWKHSYASTLHPPHSNQDEGEDKGKGKTQSDGQEDPWRTWPRPPGGFIDLGCGNGLLVHILLTLGYSGFGIDLRARKSWALYPSSTRDALRVRAFDPTSKEENERFSESFERQLELGLADPPKYSNSNVRDGIWIIGNHADEMTPWIPIISATVSSERDVGFLSIPCCAWNLDAKFTRQKGKKEKEKSAEEKALEERLGIGHGKKGSLYSCKCFSAFLSSLSDIELAGRMVDVS